MSNEKTEKKESKNSLELWLKSRKELDEQMKELGWETPETKKGLEKDHKEEQHQVVSSEQP